MTELEQHILKAVKEQLSSIKDRLKNNLHTKCRFIEMMFTCDSMIDSIRYDTITGKFDKIYYRHGIGSGMVLKEDTPFVGLFTDVEIKTIDLTNIGL